MLRSGPVVVLLAGCNALLGIHEIDDGSRGDGVGPPKADGGGDGGGSGCRNDTDCAISNACNPDGTCADVADVLYVSTMGNDADDCSFGRPCLTISHGLAGETAIKRTLRVLPGTYADQLTIQNILGFDINAEGAKLIATKAGPAITLVESNISIEGLEITGATGSNGAGILVQPQPSQLTLSRVHIDDNDGFGIDDEGGQLSVTGSVIAGNRAGGVRVENIITLAMLNDFIVGNGTASSPEVTAGVVAIGVDSGTIAFTSIANNLAVAGMPTGVSCAGTTTIAGIDDIVWGNSGSSQVTDGSGCTWSHSDIEQMTVDNSNLMTDPLFVGSTDLHLQKNSPCIDTALAESSVTVDIDGDPRPSGPAYDIGADEFVP